MKHLSSLNKYFWKYRWYFLLGILFVVLTNYFRILAPQLTGYVVNTVVHSIKAPAGGQSVPTLIEDKKNYDVLVKKVVTLFDESPARKILYVG